MPCMAWKFTAVPAASQLSFGSIRPLNPCVHRARAAGESRAVQLDPAVVDPELPAVRRPPVEPYGFAIEDAAVDRRVGDVDVRVASDELPGAPFPRRLHPPRVSDLAIVRARYPIEDVADGDSRAPEPRVAGIRRLHPRAAR